MRLFKIVDECTGGAYGKRLGLDSIALQRLHAQLRTQFLGRRIIHERPLFQRGDVVVAESLADGLQAVALHHQFLGREGCEQGGDVFQGPLRRAESAGRCVQEGCARLVAVEGEAAEPVVLLLLQHPLAESDSRGEDFGDATLYKLGLGELRILQLVADRDLVAGTDQLRKILCQSVMRDSGHGRVSLFSVGFARQHYPQHLAGDEGVVAVRFVEIPHAEQQHRLRILGLDAEILLEKRSIFLGFCHIWQ